MNKIIKDNNIGNLKNPNEKIVLVGGCFDVLHPAHREFLKKSKDLGNVLVVLLESDGNIKKLKGKNRPLNTQLRRAEKLASLSTVDYVVLLSTPMSSEYYYNLVNSLHPAIIAITKGDPLTERKKDQADMVGGQVVEVMERNEKHSSTRIIGKGKN